MESESITKALSFEDVDSYGQQVLTAYRSEPRQTIQAIRLHKEQVSKLKTFAITHRNNTIQQMEQIQNTTLEAVALCFVVTFCTSAALAFFSGSIDFTKHIVFATLASVGVFAYLKSRTKALKKEAVNTMAVLCQHINAINKETEHKAAQHKKEQSQATPKERALDRIADHFTQKLKYAALEAHASQRLGKSLVQYCKCVQQAVKYNEASKPTHTHTYPPSMW